MGQYCIGQPGKASGLLTSYQSPRGQVGGGVNTEWLNPKLTGHLQPDALTEKRQGTEWFLALDWDARYVLDAGIALTSPYRNLVRRLRRTPRAIITPNHIVGGSLLHPVTEAGLTGVRRD